MVEVGDGAKRGVTKYALALEMLAEDDREFGPVPKEMRESIAARADEARLGFPAGELDIDDLLGGKDG